MKRYIICLLLLIHTTLAFGKYQPTASNLEARQWFKGARFGLFVHWGIYSQLAHGEWVMQNQKMSLKNYEQIAPLFNPIKFDASEWVTLAKAAGMRYITFTTKHHDGFAMFSTKQSTWNVVDGSFYGKDIFKLLADECHKQDVKLFCYYSQLDWHNDNYFPRGNYGNLPGRSNNGTWGSYIQYMNAQLTELLTNYGEIAGIWFDGWWDKPYANWDLPTTFDLIHTLQPQALIGSNHHKAPFEGQDFQMFEQDLPGENSTGFEKETTISTLPLESCMTINKKSWGIDLIDTHNELKTTKELIHALAGAAGRNANLLLNVGPLADGTFPQDAKKQLLKIGSWLNKNGEAIYETSGGPLTPRAWGVTTQRENKIYVHLLSWNQSDILWLPVKNVQNVYYLKNQEKLVYERMHDGILLKDIILHDPYDTIIVLETN